MWLWPLFDWIKANKWAQIALIALATVLTLGIYLALRDNGVRQQERMRQEVERMRERAAMADRKNKVVEEERTRANEAVAARDGSVGYPDYASLPESHKSIAEGRP